MKSPTILVKRIGAMSFDEIRTRLRGWLHQRTDAWRRGRKPLEARVTPGTQVPGGRFFFDPGMAAVAAGEIAKRLPAEAASIVDVARRIQTLRFDLLGYTDLNFGDQSEPDWHLDAVHGIRAPYSVWFRIPYLNFNAVGDHKIIWELSRHQFLGLLGRAWLFTGDSSFLESLERLWRDWQKNNPYPFGINWASTLEVAFRSLSWIWMDHFIETAGPRADEFRAELRQAIGENAVYIERYLSTYFAPNTHLLGEALALFFVGVLYPHFELASRWRDRGWQVILEQSMRQVRPDGFHFEQSIYYHVYALDMFLWAKILAERNSIAVPSEFDDVIVRMTEGLAALGSGGLVPRFGDDDGGRLFDGRRNRSNHMLDPLATACVVYKRGDWKAIAGNLREESSWLLGVDGIRTFDSLNARDRQSSGCAFRESGYYAMHSGPGVAIVDAGPHGWRNGGHGHADALSMQLIANGQMWLTDPGTYSYVYEGGVRDDFRGTRAHNTLEVDKRSQAEPVHSFAWGPSPRVSVALWHVSSDIAILHGAHTGYHRLHEPVTHERWVIALKDGEWMVRDVATGKGSHQLDVRWHIAPGCTPSQEIGGYAFLADGGAVRLAYPDDSSWSTTLDTGQWSPAYGVKVPCPVLRFSYRGCLPSECSSVITLDHAEGALGRLPRANTNGAAVYVWRERLTERVIAFGTRKETWSSGPLRSDAELLILECESDRVTSLLCYGGSEIEIDGVHLKASAQKGAVFEWRAPEETASLVPTASVKVLLQALRCLEDPVLDEAASAPAGRQNNR
jgi:hypothetical protein